MSLKTIDNIVTFSVGLEDALAIRQLQPIEKRVKPQLLAIIKEAEAPVVRGVAAAVGKGETGEGNDWSNALISAGCDELDDWSEFGG